MEPVLELRNATLVRGRTRVFEDLSLTVAPREHTAVLGPNGAGKSSFIRMLTLDDTGRCDEAKIVLLSVGDGPVAAQQGAHLLVGEQPNAQVIAAAAEVVGERDIDPPDDIHASADFRRHLARVLTRRALTSAVARAQG